MSIGQLVLRVAVGVVVLLGIAVAGMYLYLSTGQFG